MFERLSTKLNSQKHIYVNKSKWDKKNLLGYWSINEGAGHDWKTGLGQMYFLFPISLLVSFALLY